MKHFSGLLVRLLAIFLLSAAPAMAYAKSSPAKPAAAVAHKKFKGKKIAAGFQPPKYASIVIDADSGKVLTEADADVQTYPASLTKMMTLYLLFGALERGQVRMNTPMNVSRNASQQAPSKLGLLPGKTLTVDQAIDALVTKSANDAAVVIGEHLAGGDEERFAAKMTSVAHALGMNQTTFRNASGLPDPGQLTTARDMALLGRRLVKDFPQYYPLFSRTDFTFASGTIHTHNHLLEFYDGADGIKTGYTAASGFNLVGSAKRGKYRLIAVVLGGTSSHARDLHMADLLDDGFAMLGGHMESLIAARRPDAARETQVAAVHQSEEEAESAGDKDEPNLAPLPRRGAIQATDLPAPPPSAELPAAPPVHKATSAPAELALPEPRKLPTTPDRKIAAAQTQRGMKTRGHSAAVASLQPARPTAATWGIQVGAYADKAKAESQAAAAAGALKATFAGASGVVQKAIISGKPMYRARVQGLAQSDLARACALMGKKAKTGCKTVPPEGTRAAG